MHALLEPEWLVALYVRALAIHAHCKGFCSWLLYTHRKPIQAHLLRIRWLRLPRAHEVLYMAAVWQFLVKATVFQRSSRQGEGNAVTGTLVVSSQDKSLRTSRVAQRH